jgi:hypothetical protein
MATNFVNNLVMGRVSINCVLQNGSPDEFAQDLRDYLKVFDETKDFPGLIIKRVGACSQTSLPKFKVSWCATDDITYQIQAMSTNARAVGAYEVNRTMSTVDSQDYSHSR